jgi:type IV secretory pathway VirB2 component (pilin)
MKKIFLIFTLLTPLVFSLLTSLPTTALDGNASKKFDEGLQKVGGQAANKDALDSPIQSVIEILLYVAGVAAVIVIVVSGIRYITSDGDAGKASQAKQVLVYAIVGLVVVVLSYAIVNFILDQVQ